MEEEKQKICMQDLRAYNNGQLIFKWYDLDDYSQVEDILKDFGDYVEAKAGYKPEELMVADYSNMPNFGEYPNYSEIQEYLDLINQSFIDVDAVKAFYDWRGDLNGFEDLYIGEYGSIADYLYEIDGDRIEELLGDRLCYYFDWDSYGRDCELNGDIYISKGGYLFHNN